MTTFVIIGFLIGVSSVTFYNLMKQTIEIRRMETEVITDIEPRNQSSSIALDKVMQQLKEELDKTEEKLDKTEEKLGLKEKPLKNRFELMDL